MLYVLLEKLDTGLFFNSVAGVFSVGAENRGNKGVLGFFMVTPPLVNGQIIPAD